MSSTLEKIFAILNYPGAATVGTVKRVKEGEALPQALVDSLVGNFTADKQDSTYDLLTGMEPGLAKTAVGFAGDVLLDPTTYFGGFGLAKKGTSWVGKLAKPALAKMGETGTGKLLTKAFKYASEVPDAVNPVTGMKLRDEARLFESTRRVKREETGHKIYEMFKDVAPDQRAALADAFEQGGSAAITDPVAQKAFKDLEAATTDIWNREIALGLADPKKFKANYLPYVFNKETVGPGVRPGFQLTHRFTNPKTIKTYSDAVKWGAEADPAKAALVRQWTGERNLQNLEFVTRLVDQYGMNAAQLKQAGIAFKRGAKGDPSAWRKVDLYVPKKSAAKAGIKAKYLPPEIAAWVEHNLMAPDGQDVEHLLGKVNRMWKSGVTTTPNFHVQNFLGNLWNMGLAGAGPGAMYRAHEFRGDKIAGNLTKQIGNFTVKDIDEAMKKYAVSGSHEGQFHEMMQPWERKLASKPNTLKNFAHTLNPARASRKVGNFIEDTAREGLFLDRIRKGDSLEEAALAVKKYLFDYGELTQTEKVVRDTAMPFYTWTRKNIPLQLEGIATQPHKYAIAEDVMRASENQQGQDLVPESKRPSFMNENKFVQTGKDTFVNPRLPFSDLGRLPSGVGMDDARKASDQLLGMLTPGIKIPLELLAMNRETFTGQPVYYKSLNEPRKAPKIVDNDIAKMLGLAAEYKGRTVVPAWERYALNNVPGAALIGRAGDLAKMQTESGSFKDSLRDLMGIPTTVMDKKTRAGMLKSEKKNKRSQDRQERRFELLWKRLDRKDK